MANKILIVCGGSGVNLLGQRRALGLDVEIQLDVSKENVIEKRKVEDRRSLWVDLDMSIGTTAVVINDSMDRISQIEKDNSSVYLQDAITHISDIAHINLMKDHFPMANALERGLAQSPAIGKYTVQHKTNRSQLTNTFREVFTKYVVAGPQNPLDVWIISSTAGGTGEGIHRFVAAFLADYLKTTAHNTPINVNFIRVGQLTYRSVNDHRTALNSFIGIAADSAFALKATNDFPQMTTNWFYIDLTDVGTGDRATRVRAEIVEMASKAIMEDELQDDLQRLLVNNQGISMVVVRTGYWGRPFGESIKYYETLRQLIIKLKDLIDPNYSRKYIDGKAPPIFHAPTLDQWKRQAQDPKFVGEHIEKTDWQFPRYRLTVLPTEPEKIEAHIPQWKISLNELLDIEIDDLDIDFQLDDVVVLEDGEKTQTINLNVPAQIKKDDAGWFKQIDSTHRTNAWSTSLLGIHFLDHSLTREGLLADLHNQAKEISKAFYGFNPFTSSEKRIKKASPLLGEFFETLVKANRLLDLKMQATRLLDRELSEPKEVLDTSEEEQKIAKSAAGVSRTTSINASELYFEIDRYAQKSWLQLLRDAVRRGDRDQFKEEVLRGATGLTESGLRSVLGLEDTADVSEIQNALSSRMGRMYNSDGQELEETPWWGASIPTPTKEYKYRILPWLDRELQGRLIARANIDDIDYRYIFSGLGVMGLYVLAFHGVSLNKEEGPDTISAPKYLLEQFVPHLMQALNRWVDNPKPHEPSGQFEIVSAGACGDPLYERAIRAAGLEDNDINKIKKYYRLYN